MIKVVVLLTDTKARAVYKNNADLESIKAKILSQMNNGNMVVLGEDRNTWLNPKYIKGVTFEVTGEDK